MLASVPAGLFSPEQRKAFLTAEKEFVAQQEAVSDRAGGHMGLGIHFGDKGEYAKSEAAYRTAFAVDPEHIESRLNLAESLYQQGRQQDALQLIGASVRVQPNNALTHEALGRYYVRQQQYEKGLRSIGTAVRLAPERPDLQYFYGVGLNQIGKFYDGLPHLKKAHELAPTNPDYLIGLATICRDNRQWVDARTYAQKLVDLQPANPGFRELLDEVTNK
jgi:tetratricopeptide (TPR) repeat protein